MRRASYEIDTSFRTPIVRLWIVDGERYRKDAPHYAGWFTTRTLQEGMKAAKEYVRSNWRYAWQCYPDEFLDTIISIARDECLDRGLIKESTNA